MDKNILIKAFGWLDYEYSLTEYFETFQDLDNSSRLADRHLANALRELGFKTLKEWKEKGGD